MKGLKIIILVLALLPSWAMAQVQNIIPRPQECKVVKERVCSIKDIRIDSKKVGSLGADEYGIRIRKGKVTIWGNSHWAMKTLAQMADNNGRVPDVDIHDWAAYPWRGFMHDTGRNYQPISMLKETIDLMARYKMNLFHWHLTDNPAWRIECRCYPQLNDAQYQRKGRDEGKFYTYDEIRELIGYARERGITVMPEIDMPGHAAYFKATFGFTMDSDEGKRVLTDCLNEFFEEIPASLCPYFHVGSDEIHIADPQGFASWIQTFVKDSGRIPVAWDPGLPTLPFTIRQGWNEASASNSESTEKEGRYLNSFVGYLNYYDPILFAMRAFQHQPCAQEKSDTTKAMGGILCLWNDVRVDKKENISLHNGMIPGMMTFAERFWRGSEYGKAENEDLYPDPSSPRGEALMDMERRMAEHQLRYYTNGEMRWVPNASMAWDITIGDKKMKAWGGGISLDALCKANGIDANAQTEAIAETTITVEKDTIIRFWLGFDTPARSDRMATGIGEQGKWENGGRCFLNGEEQFPPKAWQEPGAYNYPFHTWHQSQEEEPYTDEQFYWMREPVSLHLKKGTNTLRLVIPHSFKYQRWGFGCMAVK